jgi:thiamine-monophosphate kinase
VAAVRARTELGGGGEFDVIRRILAGSSATLAPGVIVGPGDDCAVLEHGIVVTIDMTVEGVHFRREWLSAEAIGWRAAAAALSDVAAMAATPIGVLVAIASEPADADEFLPAVMAGARESASAAGAALIGGDVTRTTGPFIIDIAAIGRSERPVLRSGARPGESVWVTGVLGGAAAAVAAWSDGRFPDAGAIEAYAHPRPRIAEALWLAERAEPSAMIDLSDGLAGDAGHLAAASGVRIAIEAALVPVHEAAREDRLLALSGGEDYELCFTGEVEKVEPLVAAFADTFGLALTRVGRVHEGKGISLTDAAGRTIERAGYSHFEATDT